MRSLVCRARQIWAAIRAALVERVCMFGWPEWTHCKAPLLPRARHTTVTRADLFGWPELRVARNGEVGGSA